jgi:hypothetical protein
MVETLIDIARTMRMLLYRLSSARVLGIDVDIVLHLGVAFVVFRWAGRRFGARRAVWLTAGLIVAKEIVDLFLKSQLRYIRRPTPAMLLDIVTDVITGVAGALLAWLLQRRAGRRSGAR